MCIRFFVFFVGVTPTPTHADTRVTLYPPRKSIATVNAFGASVWRHLDHSTLNIWRNFDHSALGKGLGGRGASATLRGAAPPQFFMQKRAHSPSDLSLRVAMRLHASVSCRMQFHEPRNLASVKLSSFSHACRNMRMLTRLSP